MFASVYVHSILGSTGDDISVRVLYCFYEHPRICIFVRVLFNSLFGLICMAMKHISGLGACHYWDD